MAERVEIRATGRDRKIFVDGTEIKDVAEYQLEQSNKVLALTLKILITGNLTLADSMGVAQSEEVMSVDYPILERIGNHYPEQGR